MDIQELFQKLVKNNSLSHSYIFFGAPDPSFVEKLANFLENKKWTKSRSSLLDLLIVAPDDKNTIGLDMIKNANHFLWQRPLRSSHKTLLIQGAASLTPQAQNAILKTAEEPPASSIIFLLIADPDQLIPPLVSRFQKIFFPSVLTDSKKDQLLKEAEKFFKASPLKKTAIIKEIVADDQCLAAFVTSAMFWLRQDPIKHFTSLKELSYRWSLISRFNVNKKLQLEAWLQTLNYPIL